jgi:hypothetical protein
LACAQAVFEIEDVFENSLAGIEEAKGEIGRIQQDPLALALEQSAPLETPLAN